MSEPKSEIIDTHLYVPSRSGFFKDKTGHALCEVFSCSNKDQCEIYASGSCVMRSVELAGRSHCPYGKITKYTGPTTRAAKFSDWVEEKREEYKGSISKLNCESKRVYSVGEFYYIPHLTLFWIRIESLRKLFKGRFIKKSDLTVEVMKSLLTERPYSYGGEDIKDYQKKDVPAFIKSVINYSPELKKIIELTGLDINLEKSSDKGRKAILQTLVPDIEVKIGDTRFKWDGKRLTAIDKISPIFFGAKGTWEMHLTPSEEVVVTIDHDGQVGPHTKFVD